MRPAGGGGTRLGANIPLWARKQTVQGTKEQ